MAQTDIESKASAPRATEVKFTPAYRNYVLAVLFLGYVVNVMIGAAYLARNIAAAAVEGRIALIATLGGHEAQLDLRYLFQKRLRLMASTLRPQSVEQKGRLARELRAHVWPLFGAHDLLPPIHARFPLVDAQRAHELMESSQHIGKILLDVR